MTDAVRSGPAITLKIYRIANGKWGGKLIDGDGECGGVAGCLSAEEVEQVVRDSGIIPARVEMEAWRVRERDA
jgi:hypothetical protein